MPRIDPGALNAFRSYDLAARHGAGALDRAAKLETVDNDVSAIQLFAEDRQGRVVPYLDADPSPVSDPAARAKLIEVSADQMTAMRGQPAAFAKFLAEFVAAQRSWLRPARADVDVPTQFKFNAVVGGRIDQFQKEATRLAVDLYGRGAQLDEALYAVNTQTFDLHSRRLSFDEFETDGYASYGRDAPFVHVWEQRLESLNKIEASLLEPAEAATLAREKKQIQNQLDAIFRSKYVYDNGDMQEANAERKMGLVMIDKQTRQRASEMQASRGSQVPRFEIMSVEHEGETKAVFADGERFFFDGSHTEIPADLVGRLQRTEVSPDNITFRRAKGDEQLRDGVRFDWDNSGFVSNQVISWVSWAGHCNDKAILEALGCVVPAGHEGVYEYDSRSGDTVHYNRNLLNEKLFSFSEMGANNRTLRGRQLDVGDQPVQFAGARDDDRPDIISLGDSQNTRIPFGNRANKFRISAVEVDGKSYGPEAFREYAVAEDEMSADKNPLFRGWTEGDRANINLGNAKVTADIEYQTYGEDGQLRMERMPGTVIDFANPGDEPIVIDSVHQDYGQRQFYEIALDPKNSLWTATLMEMVDKEGGGYEKKPVEGQAPVERRFRPAKLTASRESSLDNPREFMPFMKEVFETGRNFVAETADGNGVWNGRTRSLEQVTIERNDETKWAKVGLTIDARYGANNGAFLVKLDDQGKPDFYVPLRMPFDFVWRTDMAFAPDLDDSYNTKALERGVVSRNPAGGFSTEAIGNMMEILHCAFNDRRFVIHHEGQRYFFDKREDWEDAKTQLDQLRIVALGRAEPEPPVGGQPGPLLEVEDEANRKGQLRHFSVTAEADGPVVIDLNSLSGDSDLRVRVGRKPTREDYDYASDKMPEDLDSVTVQARKGEVIHIGVLGFESGRFDLTVKGHREAPGAALADVDVSKSGNVKAGEWADFEPITVGRNGKLDFRMTGSGDADVYVAVGRKPDTGDYDMRMYESGSNENASFKVKAGDKVYVRVHGFAEASDFNLVVRSRQ